ncbi:MAG TPA: DM13 domain-containing protein [Nitriliruptorales bacterium]
MSLEASMSALVAVESSTSTAARVLITGGIALAAFAAGVLAVLVLRAMLARRNRDVALAWVGVGGVVLALVVAVVFQPQKLFIDDVVDDPDPFATPSLQAPTTPAASSTPTAAATEPDPVPSASMLPDVTMSETMPDDPGPTVLLRGTFVDRVHPTSGTARIIELGDGSRILRLEDFSTDNGPGLRVYLSSAPPDAGNGAFDDDFVDLGALRGNIGNQNYDVPAGTDLHSYTTVVIWCDPFNVTFGVAGLT